MKNINFKTGEKLALQEYLNFLKRSDLGSQYPKENYKQRIAALLKNTDVCITARSKTGLLVGICFGQTDFAYFLFISDLGVARRYTNRGIGKRLLERSIEAAGGKTSICTTTMVHDKAIPFYKACGFTKGQDIYIKDESTFTPFKIQ